jgi:hypothetical protein
MAVQRVIAGVDDGAGEPAAVKSHRGIEDLFRRFDPIDLARRFGPESFGVAERSGVNLAVAAFVLNIHGIFSSHFLSREAAPFQG